MNRNTLAPGRGPSNPPGSSRLAPQPEVDTASSLNPSLTSAWAQGLDSLDISHSQNVNNQFGGGRNVNIYVTNTSDGEVAQTTNPHQEDLDDLIMTAGADHEIYSSQLLTKKRGSGNAVSMKKVTYSRENARNSSGGALEKDLETASPDPDEQGEVVDSKSIERRSSYIPTERLLGEDDQDEAATVITTDPPSSQQKQGFDMESLRRHLPMSLERQSPSPQAHGEDPGMQQRPSLQPEKTEDLYSRGARLHSQEAGETMESIQSFIPESSARKTKKQHAQNRAAFKALPKTDLDLTALEKELENLSPAMQRFLASLRLERSSRSMEDER